VHFQIGSYYDWATIHEIFIRAEYSTSAFAIEESIRAHYLDIASKGEPIILDLGANIGISAKYFAASYPEAIVVAVEPASKNIEALKRNSRSQQNIKVVHAAAGVESGTVSLFDTGQGNNAYRTFGESSHLLETVPCLSVPDLLNEHRSETPFLIKIDIEGAEVGLFSKNTEWVDKFKVIVVETHDWMLPGQAVSSNLMTALGGKNRDLLFRGENLFSIRND
jgi:FkbM family methyltransferase